MCAECPGGNISVWLLLLPRLRSPGACPLAGIGKKVLDEYVLGVSAWSCSPLQALGEQGVFDVIVSGLKSLDWDNVTM